MGNHQIRQRQMRHPRPSYERQSISPTADQTSGTIDTRNYGQRGVITTPRRKVLGNHWVSGNRPRNKISKVRILNVLRWEDIVITHRTQRQTKKPKRQDWGARNNGIRWHLLLRPKSD